MHLLHPNCAGSQGDWKGWRLGKPIQFPQTQARLNRGSMLHLVKADAAPSLLSKQRDCASEKCLRHNAFLELLLGQCLYELSLT